MKYYNQKDYPDEPYHTNMAHGGAGQYANIAAAGCGLCSACMIVDNMTMQDLPLLECRDLAEQIQANQDMGTDMKVLGPAVAEKYGLLYDTTSDLDVLKKHLQAGGMAIANAGGDREGYIGLLSHGGHFVTVVSVDGDTYCILDPSWTRDKYAEEGRQGKVKEHYPFIYVQGADLAQDCANREPSFYLFRRAE